MYEANFTALLKIFWKKQSLMNETYFGEAGGERIVLEDLEIEGWKRNGFTHNTFWSKTVLMYDAYFCGAGGEATFRADLVVRGGKETSVQNTRHYWK